MLKIEREDCDLQLDWDWDCILERDVGGSWSRKRGQFWRVKARKRKGPVIRLAKLWNRKKITRRSASSHDDNMGNLNQAA